MKIRLADKEKCLKREIAMRQRVYPSWVAKGKMKQEQADHEIKVMQAILDDYKDLDEAPCNSCGEWTTCVPEGLCYCEKCALKMGE